MQRNREDAGILLAGLLYAPLFYAIATAFYFVAAASGLLNPRAPHGSAHGATR